MTDGEIVRLFCDRDEEAVKAASDKYGSRLRAVALAVTGDPGAADECVNDALLRAWEHIPPAKPSNHLFAFLAKTVRGIAIDRLRRESAQKRSAVFVELTNELAECLPSRARVEDEALAKELSGVINGFVRELPRDKQLIFIRRYWYFEAIADISESLGFTESKVKTELARMRKKLKSLLERKGYTL